MTDRDTLIRCFLAVFPALPAAQIPKASTASVSGWDSVAAVTLLALIEEEFNIQLSPLDLEKLTSFELILNYIQTRLRS
jgi:acyl carrier protein